MYVPLLPMPDAVMTLNRLFPTYIQTACQPGHALAEDNKVVISRVLAAMWMLRRAGAPPEIVH
jgi:hypothetical protein